MLETHFAGKITKKRQNFDPSTPPADAENLHFTLNRNKEGPWATSRPCPDGLGRRRQGKLRGTAVFPQTTLGQSSIAPGQTDLYPGKKEKLTNKQ
jgi:hypothetical protein